MCEPSRYDASLTVDLKKFGLRLHKSCFRLLGSPRYIQLLVNPDDMAVAIRSVHKDLPKDCIHKIDTKKMNSDNSYEIYSRSFVRKLCEVVGGLDEGYSYRLRGKVYPDEDAAIFTLKNIQKITHQQEPLP